jgi:hypothetical protein|uniref:Uncharacterized protein n=1 Tax=viral metagenome TaxID=1070528 RepID=A0A6C0BL24_9ZZZZ
MTNPEYMDLRIIAKGDNYNRNKKKFSDYWMSQDLTKIGGIRYYIQPQGLILRINSIILLSSLCPSNGTIPGTIKNHKYIYGHVGFLDRTERNLKPRPETGLYDLDSGRWSVPETNKDLADFVEKFAAYYQKSKSLSE